MKKRVLAAVAAATVGLSSAVAIAPAQAASMYDCSWPNVCLYDGAYQKRNDFISVSKSYTKLTKNDGNRADAVVNSLNDDSVWLITEPGWPNLLKKNPRYLCIPANTAVNLGTYAHPSGGTWANKVDAIKIWGDPDNGKCSGTTQVKQGEVKIPLQ